MSADEKLQIKARRQELEADGSELKAYTLAKSKLKYAMRYSTDVDRIADSLRGVSSAKFVLTLMTEDSKKPFKPRNRKRTFKVLSEQAVASAKGVVSAAPKRQRRRGVVVQGEYIVKFVPTTRADFESDSEYEEHLDYVQQLQSN